MSKHLLLIAMISLSICAANASTQSPFAANHQMNMESAQAAAVNDAEMDIMDVIKEKPVVPASSHKSTYSSYSTGNVHSSRFSGTDMPEYGVNDSKTIYKDGIGRLHFFGKGNIIRE